MCCLFMCLFDDTHPCLQFARVIKRSIRDSDSQKNGGKKNTRESQTEFKRGGIKLQQREKIDK